MISKHSTSTYVLKTFNAWQEKRGKLNHDCIQNKYIVFLSAQTEELLKSERSDKVLSYELYYQFIYWDNLYVEIKALLAEAAEALSPEQIYNKDEWKLLFKDNVGWLKTVSRYLYLSRSGIPELISKINNLADSTNEIYCELQEYMSSTKSNNNDFQKTLQFNESVITISKLISKIPTELVLK